MMRMGITSRFGQYDKSFGVFVNIQGRFLLLGAICGMRVSA